MAIPDSPAPADILASPESAGIPALAGTPDIQVLRFMARRFIIPKTPEWLAII